MHYRNWKRTPNEKPERKDVRHFGVTHSDAGGCDCDVLPWEDCEHTEQLGDEEMEHIRAIVW